MRAMAGSGSAYIYGYCDSNWKEGWGEEETVEFVKNGELRSSERSAGLPMTPCLNSAEPGHEPRWLVRGHDPHGRHLRRWCAEALYSRKPAACFERKDCIVDGRNSCTLAAILCRTASAATPPSSASLSL